MHDIKPNTFLKSTKEAEILSNEVFNKELKQVIINAIDKKQVQNLPIKKPFENFKDFKGLFDEVKGSQGMIKTPYKNINVNLSYAFNHFVKNTYNINRDNIKSAFFQTFKDPLFVIEFTPKGRIKPSVYFYKPFYDKNKKLLNLIGISVSEKGQLNFSTFYLDKRGNRLNEFLNKEAILIKYVKPNI